MTGFVRASPASSDRIRQTLQCRPGPSGREARDWGDGAKGTNDRTMTTTPRFTAPMIFALFASGTALGQAEHPKVVLETNKGAITVELFEDKAPVTVENFLKYVDDGHYDNVVFHRVIPGFMIQGGGFANSKPPQEKPTRDPIKNEGGNGLANTRGTLAMARTSDPNSASAQFFINLADNAFLDRPNAADRVGYAVFGRVVDGMDVVDEIAKVQTQDRVTLHDENGRPMSPPADDVPVTPVVITSAKRAE